MRLDVPAGKVEIVVEHRGTACCPHCGKSCPGYDSRLRHWRHLDGRRVLSVLDGRTRESVDAQFSAQPAHERERVEVVAMDMWRPHVDATARWLPNTAMCFDRFHVAVHLGDAVNTVRK